MKAFVLICFCVLLSGCDNPPKYKLVKSGEVSQVDYQQGNFSESAKTIIGFKDGSFKVLRGSFSIPSVNIDIYQQDRKDNTCDALYDYHKVETTPRKEN